MPRQLLALLALALLLGACASNPPVNNSGDTGKEGSGDTAEPEDDMAKVERDALSRIGDVRIYYFQKPGIKPAGYNSGRTIEQPRQLHVLVNKGHSWYRDIPDYKMKPEERYLHSVDMHDLLLILRDQVGFFEKGAAVNIKGDDPVKRAEREDATDRMIAVEQIKDGKVNTSYFARRLREDSIDADRAKRFNEAQAFVLQAVGNALPRGSIGDGKGENILDQQNRRGR